jgi:hypothetical protein
MNYPTVRPAAKNIEVIRNSNPGLTECSRLLVKLVATLHDSGYLLSNFSIQKLKRAVDVEACDVEEAQVAFDDDDGPEKLVARKKRKARSHCLNRWSAKNCPIRYRKWRKYAHIELKSERHTSHKYDIYDVFEIWRRMEVDGMTFWDACETRYGNRALPSQSTIRLILNAFPELERPHKAAIRHASHKRRNNA